MRVGGSTLTKVCTLKEDKQKYSWNEEIDLAAYMGGKSSPKERERYSNFQKWREIEERKVDFIQHIEFLRGWYKYKKKRRMEKMRAFFLGGKQKREDGQHALEGFKEKRKNKWQAKGSDLERKKDWRIFGRNTEEAGNEQLQPRLSRYASCYSWNSYPYSISLCVRF